MTKSKPTPYPYILGGSLTIDVAFFAPKMIDEHADLTAKGYVLKSPVTAAIRKDGTLAVPFRYTRKSGTKSGAIIDRTGWTVTVYAGGLFGKVTEVGHG